MKRRWLAFSVVRLLEEHFPRFVSYEFTALMEDVLDEIARGDKDRISELAEFYYGSDRVEGLHTLVNELGDIDAKELATFPIGGAESGIVLRGGRYGPYLEGPGEDGAPSGRRANVPDDLPPDELTLAKARELFANPAGEEVSLGTHPESGLKVVAKNGRFGPYVEMGDGKEAKRGSIPKDIPSEEFGLDWAVKLLSLPRLLGEHPETGKPITASIGRYGPYLAHDGKYARLQSTRDVFETGMNAAVVKLAEAASGGGRARGGSREPLKLLGKHPRTDLDIKLMEGRYGAYVTDGTTNATLPKTLAQDALTLEEAAQLLDERAAKGPTKKKGKAAPKKKAPTKKTAKT